MAEDAAYLMSVTVLEHDPQLRAADSAPSTVDGALRLAQFQLQVVLESESSQREVVGHFQ